jgi:hypothetical protein
MENRRMPGCSRIDLKVAGGKYSQSTAKLKIKVSSITLLLCQLAEASAGCVGVHKWEQDMCEMKRASFQKMHCVDLTNAV